MTVSGLPLVSIVTVCYNSAAHIEDALRSVDEQSWPYIEHLIFDGASTDRTMQIIQAHSRQGRQVLSEPDRGIYDAMNKGLALARGDYVGFLNADDMLADGDAITRLAATVRRTQCDALYSDLVYVGAQDTARVIRHWRSGRFTRGALARGWMPPHPTFYVRREVLQRVGRFDASMRIAADYEFMLRVLIQPGIAVAKVPGLLVRMRTGGASNRSLSAIWRKSREDLCAMRRHDVGGLATLLCKNFRKLPQLLDP
jgi:glycosyltransferase